MPDTLIFLGVLAVASAAGTALLTIAVVGLADEEPRCVIPEPTVDQIQQWKDELDRQSASIKESPNELV